MSGALSPGGNVIRMSGSSPRRSNSFVCSSCSTSKDEPSQEQLGVHPPVVSMSLHGKRWIPERSRPRLLTWAQQAQRQAQAQVEINLKAQPNEELRLALLDTFFAPLQQWRLEVLYEEGVYARSIRRECR